MTTSQVDHRLEAADAASFSLFRGGLLHRMGARIGIPDDLRGTVVLGVVLALVTWLPLLILSAFDNTLLGGRMVPFLPSTGTHVRFLVAIPLFFIAEAAFDVRTAQVIGSVVHGPLIPVRERPQLDATVARIARWRDAGLIEGAALGITVFLAFKGIRVELPTTVSTWQTDPSGAKSLAGLWHAAASVPIFQFLAMRWAYHFVTWGMVLFRLSRLSLHVIPTHPDLSGGLGCLAIAHVALAPLSFAISAILAGDFAERMRFAGEQIRDVVLPLGFSTVGQTLLLVAPLLLFAPRLLDAKVRGLLEYGDLASDYTRAFDDKWLRHRRSDAEPLLGTADVQSLADLGGSFDVIRQMRLVPIEKAQIMRLAIAAAAPALPLVLFVIPFEELVIRGAKTVLHL